MNRLVLPFASLLSLTACGSQQAEPQVAPTQTEEAASAVAPVALDASKIVYSMRGNEDDYRKCFMRSPQTQGAVSVRFDIAEDGTVASTTILWSSHSKKSVQQCLLDRLSLQKFGPKQAPTYGEWTFVFGLTEAFDDEDREEMLERADEADLQAFQLLPHSQGTIDENLLHEKVQVRYPIYATCYRDSIKRRGESRGLLRLRLQIDEDGRLADVEDAGSVLPDAYAVDCMASAFYAITYPKPEGGPVEVEYRLDFE